MYRILVCNDDGIDAEGIRRLVGALSAHGVVYVVAPNGQRSAKSQSLSGGRVTLGIKEVEIDGAEQAFAFDGTPTDCAIWGLQYLKGERGIDFDFVVSGINMGNNCGSSIYYSGTLGAAREAALQGVRGIAMSVNRHKATNFDYLCNNIGEILAMSERLGRGSLINIVSPDIPEWNIKGVKITEAAPHSYAHDFVFENRSPGFYRIGVERYDERENRSLCLYDCDAVDEGYVSVTPLSMTLTDRTQMKKLAGRTSDRILCVFADMREADLEGVRRKDRLCRKVRELAEFASSKGMQPAAVNTYKGTVSSLSGSMIDDIPGIMKIDVAEGNCFGSTDLCRLADLFSPKRVIIAGTKSERLVTDLALGFRDRDFDVTVIRNCCSSEDGDRHFDAMDRLAEEGCRVIRLCDAKELFADAE